MHRPSERVCARRQFGQPGDGSVFFRAGVTLSRGISKLQELRLQRSIIE